MQIDLTKKPKQEVVDDASVKYTKQIISALKKKVREHNATGGEKITFNQLKMVFLEGANKKEEGKSLPLCGLARVNMFLRLFRSSTIAHEFKASPSVKSGRSLTFDFTGYISPKEEDFALASEEVVKYDLTFDVNPEDLYFSDYEHMTRYEEYL